MKEVAEKKSRCGAFSAQEDASVSMCTLQQDMIHALRDAVRAGALSDRDMLGCNAFEDIEEWFKTLDVNHQIKESLERTSMVGITNSHAKASEIEGLHREMESLRSSLAEERSLRESMCTSFEVEAVQRP